MQPILPAKKRRLKRLILVFEAQNTKIGNVKDSF
jgi:hypothetical protein